MLIPLLALAMIPQSQLTTGTRLFESCQDAKRFFDNDPKFRLDRVSECIAYIGGYMDAQSFNLNNFYCLDDVTTGTLVRIYVAFMDKNPKLLDSPRSVGFLGALMDSYPCPAKK